VSRRTRPSKKKVRSAEPQASVAPPTGLWWRAALIVVVGALTYSNSLAGPFILDDQSTIVDNPQIRELSRLSSVLVPEENSSMGGRPIVNLSFAINYSVGDLSVPGYHIGNVAIHLVCALLALGLIRRTLELPRLRGRLGASSMAVAFAVALLWTVHPLNSEVVDYITQRTESLMAMFYLATLYSSVRALAAAPHSFRWQAVAAIACGLGMLCKESMVTAPLMVALYDRAYVFDSWKQELRARRGFYLSLAATWLILAVVISAGPRAAVVGFSSGVSPWTYLLNQTLVISRYLSLVVWPSSLVVFYGWPLPLTFVEVVPYALLIGCLFLATLTAWFRSPAWGFLGLWFFIILAPSSSIVPIATEVGAERRMYLPLLAVIALAVLGTVFLWQVVLQRRPERESIFTPGATAAVGIAVLVLTTASLAGRTLARNSEYSSAITLAETVVQRRPTAVAHHILAEQLALADRHDEAIVHLRQATAGGDSRASYLLGTLLFNTGNPGESIEQLEAFVRTSELPYRLVPRWLEPPIVDVIAARSLLARIFVMQSRWSEASEQARRVLTIDSSNLEARGLLADALFGQQQFEEASVNYRQYLMARADDVHALTNFAVTRIAAGSIDEAVAAFRRAVDVDPRNPNSRRLLTMALMDAGDFEAAAVQAREGIALSPGDPAMRELFDRARSAGKQNR
jgi:protein O-mannosyl-transferase